MPFLVQACLDDHTLAVTTATAKEAFAKAVEWHVTGRFDDVTISDKANTYSIDAFAFHTFERFAIRLKFHLCFASWTSKYL